MRPFGLLTAPAWDDGYAAGKCSSRLEIDKAQARIKELEETLRFYADKSNYYVATRGRLVYEYRDKEEDLVGEIGTIAKKVLEKERE